MSSTVDTTTQTHIYRLKWGWLAFNVLALGFMGVLFGGFFIAMFMGVSSAFQAEPGFDAFDIFLVCLLAPPILMLIVFFYSARGQRYFDIFLSAKNLTRGDRTEAISLFAHSK